MQDNIENVQREVELIKKEKDNLFVKLNSINNDFQKLDKLLDYLDDFKRSKEKITISFNEDRLNRLVTKLNLILSDRSQILDYSLSLYTSIFEKISNLEKIKDEFFSLFNKNSTLANYREKIKILLDNLKNLKEEVGVNLEIFSKLEFSISEYKVITETVSSTIDKMMNDVEGVSFTISELYKSYTLTYSDVRTFSGSLENIIENFNKLKENIKDIINLNNVIYDKFNNIKDSIEVIDDIADQTNIVALNAAIEAAHSGEVGRGFAVVADVIKQLSDKSKKSTKDIRNSLEGLGIRIDELYNLIRQRFSTFDNYVSDIEKLKVEVEKIVGGFEKLNSYINEVSSVGNQVGSVSSDVSKKLIDFSNSIERVSGFLIKLKKFFNSLTVGIENSINLLEDLYVYIDGMDEKFLRYVDILDELDLKIKELKEDLNHYSKKIEVLR